MKQPWFSFRLGEAGSLVQSEETSWRTGKPDLALGPLTAFHGESSPASPGPHHSVTSGRRWRETTCGLRQLKKGYVNEREDA